MEIDEDILPDKLDDFGSTWKLATERFGSLHREVDTQKATKTPQACPMSSSRPSVPYRFSGFQVAYVQGVGLNLG